MIKLSKLYLKNFFSHVDTELDFESYEGLVLVEGHSHDGHYSSNGSGKSTLLEGIIYALTGNTLRGVSVNDVVNRNANKNTNASLEIRRDSVKYIASRYRKDDTHGDNLLLYKEDENISKRVKSDTQSLLDDILNISYKILVSTIFLGEGLSSRFTQLSDPDKKSLIESTLNLQYDMSKLRDKANSAIKSMSLELATINGEISVLEELSAVDVTLLEDSISDSLDCIRIYEETASHLKEQYDESKKTLESILPKLNLLNEALSKVENLRRDYAELFKLCTQYNLELEKVSNSPTPVCSLCHQSLGSATSRSAVIDHYQSLLKDTTEKFQSVAEEIQKLPDKDVLLDKIKSISNQYMEKDNEASSLMREYQSYNVKIAEAKKDIESLRATLNSLERNNDSVSEKIAKREELQKQIAKYEYFYKLFSPTGIIVSILSDAIKYINERLATYSEVLLEKDYSIQFLKGKISLVDSKGSSYQSLSNGEKRRLDIAIQFSLHDYVCKYCGNEVDTMFIDEILDTLDDIGIENIITVLRLKLEYCNLSRIFVISHNSELKSYFDKVITVVKDAEGDSKIS